MMGSIIRGYRFAQPPANRYESFGFSEPLNIGFSEPLNELEAYAGKNSCSSIRQRV